MTAPSVLVPLLPCPFCGSNPETKAPYGEGLRTYVECPNYQKCPLGGVMIIPNEWNRRTSNEPPKRYDQADDALFLIATAKEDKTCDACAGTLNTAKKWQELYSKLLSETNAAKEETPPSGMALAMALINDLAEAAVYDIQMDGPKFMNWDASAVMRAVRKHDVLALTGRLSQSKDRQIPEGYALVPIEPNVNQVTEGAWQFARAATGEGKIKVEDIYKAMIAAAPVEGE